jgi:AmmeMemoRadiSam system protein A
VGYCTGIFEPIRPKIETRQKNTGAKDGSPKPPGEKEDSCVRLARLALETYVREGRKIDPPDWMPRKMIGERAGVFVSIKQAGQLRGCIGTISPTTENISREIIENAISAGIRDPRFFPVNAGELENLVYSVDVLGKPEAIQSTDELDAKKYGVIVRSGRRSGLLLPDIEGVDTPAQQIAIAMQKAGIGRNESYALERFKVTRHS